MWVRKIIGLPYKEILKRCFYLKRRQTEVTVVEVYRIINGLEKVNQPLAPLYPCS